MSHAAWDREVALKRATSKRQKQAEDAIAAKIADGNAPEDLRNRDLLGQAYRSAKDRFVKREEEGK